MSTCKPQLHTLPSRRVVGSSRDVWEWQYREYRGRYQSGTELERLPEEGVRGSFTPLQLDVWRVLQ